MLRFIDEIANLPPEFKDITGEACQIWGRFGKWTVPEALKNHIALIFRIKQ